jgi:type IV pilus assembly protein PilE
MQSSRAKRTGIALEKKNGFSLLELMIVVAIISIISAIAYPSYMEYVVKAKRTTASSMLMQVADRQQQFFMDNKRYADDMTNLGFQADPLVIDNDGRSIASGSSDSIYSIALSGVTVTTYTATASPQKAQATRDTKCANLTLNQAGAKGHSGTGSDCWS